MKKSVSEDVLLQRQYYTATAAQYDGLHLDVDEQDEHFFALAFLVSVLDYFQIRSVLDIGSGTGRAISYLKKKMPELKVVGVEPVQELREIGYSKGLSDSELVAGNAEKLQFENGEFDLVCEFGVLHHIKNHGQTVSEMLRVADKAVFISDSNNFGQGSFPARMLKQLIRAVGLWRVADFIKTKGKGYTISEGDGLAYSYSVFDDYPQIASRCRSVHLLNTNDGRINPYRTASHVALLGMK